MPLPLRGLPSIHIGCSGTSDGKARGLAMTTPVIGVSTNNVAGVSGESQDGEGVHGVAHSVGAGVGGYNDNPQGSPGVWGESSHGEGVHGVAHFVGAGVGGYNDYAQGGPGTWGESAHGEGVHGISHSPGAGVAGYNDNPQGGPGIWGQSAHGPAGHFEGDVHVTGDLILDGADYAEALTVADQEVLPGMTVVVDERGLIRPCAADYDPRVAGIIAGACGVRSALVLDRHDGGAAVALMGKVWALADASELPIRCGDLLTTSATPGHARRADDRTRAFGCVIGKALTSLDTGRGFVRVLVNIS